MYDLVLCEKPSQGRAVADALGAKASKPGYREGSGYVVTWCLGHLLELCEPADYDAKYKKWVATDLPILPEKLKYRVSPSKRTQYKVIAGLLKKASRVIIATDCDREGEAIARHILDRENFKGEIKRAWFTSQDEKTLKQAFNNLLDANKTKNLALAAYGRAGLDWLSGMNFSRALSLREKQRVNFKISAGRVQTPALYICCKRELDIKNFIPTLHFGVNATVKSGHDSFDMSWKIIDDVKIDGYLIDRDVAEFVRSSVNGMRGVVTLAEYKQKYVSAPLPYTMTSLVSDAEKFGLTPDDTKKALQELYEPPYSLVTYPRTDCPYLPENMISESHEVLVNAAKLGYLTESSFIDPKKVSKAWNDKKLVGHSHHGIIPTTKLDKASSLSGHLAIVYDLIIRRFLMQFAPEQELFESSLEVEFGQFLFRTSGTSERFPGWKSLRASNVHLADKDRIAKFIPRLSIGQALICESASITDKKTEPPKRFTLASLQEEMGAANKYCLNKDLSKVLKDGDGIGTEATRPDIITELVNKKHIMTDKKNRVFVTDEIVRFVMNIPDEIRSVDSTAILELGLKEIELGRMDLNTFLAAQKEYIANTVRQLLSS